MIERKHIEAIGAVWDKLFNEEDRQLPPLNDAAYISCCSLSAAISAALAAPEESPWRSMESAPRDGTWIEVGRHIDGEWEYCKSGYFHDAGDVMSGEPPYDFWAADYDMRGVTNDGGMWLTHWRPCDDGPAMPLPAAPEVKP